MRIDVIGAGPAGLYFAILVRRSRPDIRVRVYERNRADDTFGFGIVLSDETLDNLRRADAPSWQAIAARFAYWDDIYTHVRGDVHRSRGHGFSGIKRIALLDILQTRARELGVELVFGADRRDLAAHADADLVIAADGIHSAVRSDHAAHFGPEIDLRPNRFVWLGAQATLPGFTYAFVEDAAGIWNLHAYMYAPGECTLVVETTAETFARSGLAEDDEAATAAHAERLFGAHLGHARVLTNRSVWRRFPTVRCRTWHLERTRSDGGTQHVVLLGDAAHSAHFSIGSGSKLALEDAIALHAALVHEAWAPSAAVVAYEGARREEVEKTQHAANVSLGWFENVRRFWSMPTNQFNYSLLSRSKQITHENLRLRDPDLVHDMERWFAQQVAREVGARVSAEFRAPPLFAPFALRDMRLANRIVVSPMAQYSAVDGVPGDWHLVHYGSRALGGAGLVFVEMTCPTPEARITPGCTGLWNDAQQAGFARIVDFVHAHTDAKLCMQLGHAGRKGSTQVGWEGTDMPLRVENGRDPNWPLLAPSPLPYRAGVNQTPREMTRADMDQVIDDFVRATYRAQAAGFDMLELHMAHGYLFASFLSPVTNRRTDAYGGSLEGRMRFPLDLWDAVRAVWPADRPMSVRISATDWIAGGTTGDDAVAIARAFKSRGCDLIDVSTGQTDPASNPVYGRMYQATFSEWVRLEAGMPTMAVGAITTADQANTLLVSGRADLVALARPHLADPYFALHAAAQAGYEGAHWPPQYQSGAAQVRALARREREDVARKAQAEASKAEMRALLSAAGVQVAADSSARSA